jgi:FkbM family methyltransferase
MVNWVKRKLTSVAETILPWSIKDRLIRHYSIPSVDWSLRNARKNGFSPEAIIDVGAYVGSWTRMVNRIFPEVKILAVEPQHDKGKDLQQLSRSLEGVQYEKALLGSKQGEKVTLHLNETVSSVLPEKRSKAPGQEERVLVTLDALVDGTVFQHPDLLKLDVQGYELEVLKGFEQTLASSPPEMIQMEVSLIEINEGAPLFRDVIAFMRNHEYRLYDICSLIRRPLDDALWQIDVLFVTEGSELVSSHQWANGE